MTRAATGDVTRGGGAVACAGLGEVARVTSCFGEESSLERSPSEVEVS